MVSRLSSILLIVAFLLGCTLQSPPSAVLPAASPAPAPATASPEPPVTIVPTPSPAAEQSEPTAWTIGLLEEPANLLPFSPDGRAAAPIVQALFPAPVLSHSYAYTTTGILAELPTVANGGVQTQPVTGFLDATGQFTLTETAQPTTTEQLAVTFRWSDKLRWADGAPLTAADSVFAYELFGQVQGPQEAEVLHTKIERYEQVDEHTTRALLKPGQIDPAYLLTAWPPLPRHQLKDLPPEDALAELGQRPLGYGPYSFDQQRPGDQLVLVRNEYWPAKDALPEQLVFRFFGDAKALRDAASSGEVDVGALEMIPQELYAFLDQDQQSGAASVVYKPGPVYEHLDLNLADTRLEDVRVRRALAYALDRQALSDTFFGSKVRPLNSWILPEQRAFYAGDEQLARYNFDPAKARALLDEAGLTDTDGDGIRELPDGNPFTLTLLTSDTPLREALAERIVGDWQSIGVQGELELQPVDQLYSPTGPLYRRTFQAALFAWITDVDPGGLPLWSCNAIPMQENGYTGNNFGGWCFEAAEWPLRRANSVLDERIRAQEYLKQQQHWTREVPVIPLLQRPLAVLHHPRIRGIAPDALAPVTWNIDQWRRVP